MKQNDDFASIVARRRARPDGAPAPAPTVQRTVGDTSRGNVLSRDGMTRALYLVTILISLVALFEMWR